jgi:hypothetical protein
MSGHRPDGETVLRELPSKRHRFQLSIRKLMLWTVVVAIYLGILAMLKVPPINLAFFTLWLAVVGFLRTAFGPGQLVFCRLWE